MKNYIKKENYFNVALNEATDNIEICSNLEELEEKMQDEIKFRRELEWFYNAKISLMEDREEVFLRISTNKRFVETSRGVSLSLGAARKLYVDIMRGQVRHDINDSTYIINKLNKWVSIIRIGCHTIKVDDIISIGEFLLKKTGRRKRWEIPEH